MPCPLFLKRSPPAQLYGDNWIFRFARRRRIFLSSTSSYPTLFFIRRLPSCFWFLGNIPPPFLFFLIFLAGAHSSCCVGRCISADFFTAYTFFPACLIFDFSASVCFTRPVSLRTPPGCLGGGSPHPPSIPPICSSCFPLFAGRSWTPLCGTLVIVP